jgi:hypothetical protein
VDLLNQDLEAVAKDRFANCHALLPTRNCLPAIRGWLP